MFQYSAMLDLLINRVDLFGKPVALNFNGRDKSKSFIGAIFSFLFFGFVVWAFYSFSQDMFKKRNPKTITSQSFDENPQEIIIDPDTFAFGFGLQHPETFFHYIDERIYTVEVTLNQLRREGKPDGSVEEIWSTAVLETEPCTTAHYGKLGHKFVDIELSKLYCLKQKQSALEEIRIQGVFESPIYEYVKASIKACDNRTSSCATPKELNYYLGGAFFAVYFTNIAIDPKNYTNPNINYRDSYFSSTTFPYFKEVTLWLSHLSMKSDIGWLTAEEKSVDFVSFDKTMENLNFRTDMGAVLNMIVRVGKIKTHYERSYTKISDILAEVNGLMAAVFVGAAIVLYPYSNIKFYESLINELFDVTALSQDSANKELKRGNSKSPKSLQKSNTQIPGSASPRRSPDRSPVRSPRQKKKHIQLDMSELDLGKSAQPSPNEASIDSAKKKLKVALNEEKTMKRSETRKASLFGKNNNPPRLTSPSSIIGLDEKAAESERNGQELDKSSFYEREQRKSQRQTKILIPAKGDESSRFDLSTNRSQLLFDLPKAARAGNKILEHYETKSPTQINIVLEDLLLDQKEMQDRRDAARKSARFTSRKFEKILGQVVDNESVNEVESLDETFSPKTREGMRRAEVKERAKVLPDKLTRESDRINITFWNYLQGYFWRTSSVKEKFQLLNEGIRRIEERLDIFNVFKKFREVDKLKLLLLEHEQLVLFDTLPKPELALNPDRPVDAKTSKSISHLRESRFIAEKRRNDLIMLAYENSKNKHDKTLIDERLLQLYDDIIDY